MNLLSLYESKGAVKRFIDSFLLFFYTKKQNEEIKNEFKKRSGLMKDKKKIEILQEENARLRKELQRVKYLYSDEVAGYVDGYEKANRELFIELRELRDNYRKTSEEAAELLKRLRKVGKAEGAKWRLGRVRWF